MKLLDFQLVFLFEFFETQVGGGFVVAHVVVPGTAEFQKLGSLGALNRDQFLLLSLPHVLQKP